jgi:hypothetical protein
MLRALDLMPVERLRHWLPRERTALHSEDELCDRSAGFHAHLKDDQSAMQGRVRPGLIEILRRRNFGS